MRASTHFAGVKAQADSRPRFPTMDPSNEEAGITYSGHSPDDAREIAQLTRAAFDSWRPTSFAERGSLMKAAAATLRRRQDELAELMTAEMGKLLKDGLAEVEK
jgi:succinate-semialdehyde dehydrogenase/glutarate-semialdehyde dehydrogenase